MSLIKDVQKASKRKYAIGETVLSHYGTHQVEGVIVSAEPNGWYIIKPSDPQFGESLKCAAEYLAYPGENGLNPDDIVKSLMEILA